MYSFLCSYKFFLQTHNFPTTAKTTHLNIHRYFLVLWGLRIHECPSNNWISNVKGYRSTSSCESSCEKAFAQSHCSDGMSLLV